MTELKGFDLSHHNPDPAFNVVKSHGVDVMYHKATEGDSYVDPKMAVRIVNAHHAGLHVGVYHFARFTSVADAIKEANYFISTVKSLDKYIDMPYMLDIEVNDSKLSIAEMTKACVAFLEAVKVAFKKPVLVYTYDSFISPNLGKELGQYPLWLADYGNHVLAKNVVWSEFKALQYSEKGTVAGINGLVDVDNFDSSLVIVPTPAYKTHKVVSGDTLSELAVKFNTTVGELKKLNKINDEDMISIGEVIKYPFHKAATVKKLVHTVVRGDTVSELAKHYKTTVAAIQHLNKLDKECVIRIGEKLKID